MAKRVFILLLDSFGIGALPDAERFGDVGANTLGHIAAACAAGEADRAGVRQGELKIPHLAALGLYAAAAHDANFSARGYYGSSEEISFGKDTSSGHWEMMGAPVLFDWGYFPNTTPCFPEELVNDLIREAGISGVLGNCHASGTEIIQRLGDEHIATGQPICYTSADSVFQIAAHEEAFGLERLYQLCKTAFRLVQGYQICRVIARPFTGTTGNYVRTENRRDFSVAPPLETLLDRLVNRGKRVVAVGKIADIFAHRGISQHLSAHGHLEIYQQVKKVLIENQQEDTLVFANFVDFDMKYGHRRDVVGYAHALEEFDQYLADLMTHLRSDDLLLVTADHGCDPTFRGSDHTREAIPILMTGEKLHSHYLGVRKTYADIGQTLAEFFGVGKLAYGESFLAD